METKFTPGPWVADIRVGCCAVYVQESRDEWEQGLHNDDRNIFYANYPNVTVKGDTNQSVEAIANAHLIAAAPELYEMLDAIRCFLSEDGLQTSGLAKEIAKIPELLDKVRGEYV